MAKRKKPRPVSAPRPKAKPAASRRGLFFGALGVALALAAGLITVSLATGGSATAPPRTGGPQPAIAGVAAVRSLLAGIPQHGSVLGSPKAPVTLVEYADPQCPYCAEWARGALPAIVDEYVRPGHVRIEYRGIAFIGPESTTGLAAAVAAGRQDKFWHVVDLLYANQGAENSGWINDRLLSSIAKGAGIDWGRFAVEWGSAGIARAVDASTARARRDGIASTPSFLAGPTAGGLEPIQITSLDAGAIRPTLNRLLGR